MGKPSNWNLLPLRARLLYHNDYWAQSIRLGIGGGSVILFHQSQKLESHADAETKPAKLFLGFMKFEWCLATFALGICLYFSWPSEPLWWSGVLVFFAIFFLLMITPSHVRLNEYVLLCLFLIAGFSRGVLHTKSVSTPIFPDYQRTYEISGWVESMNASNSLKHFYIRVHNIKNLPDNKTPYRVRVRLKPYDFVPGDAILVRAVMSGPRTPVIAGGYDPARAAYYKKTGGFGFAISKPEHVVLGKLPQIDRLKRCLSTFRYKLSRKIQARAPPKTAGLQSALLTGDRSAIPEAQKQALRDAGLAHLLAISGLHMGLLAGGVYSLASLLFAMIGPMARRYDMRKYAALLGACTAIAYLLLSGASVSTQRAFIMAIIVFAAVILNRRAISLRSVALAAGITLLLHPESLISAGFQMSFAATMALVVVYRSWADKRTFTYTGTLFGRIRNGFVGIAVTSFVAGIATGGFAALHFHRFARLGFIANLAAMPIFTFIAMPAGFFALLLMPLGLDVYALNIMGIGLGFVLQIAEWIAAKDLAVMQIKGATGIVTSLFGFGFIGLCISIYAKQFGAMIMSGIVMLISIGLWSGTSRVDMRISDTARIAFWDTKDANVLQVDHKRGDKFGRERWVEMAGLIDILYNGYYDTMALCDQLACRIEIKSKIISIVSEPEGVIEACGNSDIVILTKRNAGVRARRSCKSILIDRKDLQNGGARDIYINDNGIRIKKANPQKRQNRPWG